MAITPDEVTFSRARVVISESIIVFFQYHAEMPPITVQLEPSRPNVHLADGVLHFCGMDGSSYNYNWDLVSHYTIYATPPEKETP